MIVASPMVERQCNVPMPKPLGFGTEGDWGAYPRGKPRTFVCTLVQLKDQSLPSTCIVEQ